MNLSLTRKLKMKTNRWDSWREQGQQKEMSSHLPSQMRLKKFIKQAEILIQFKGRMKQLSKRAQWNVLVKSLKNLYPVSIIRINPMISSQQTKRVTTQEKIQRKLKVQSKINSRLLKRQNQTPILHLFQIKMHRSQRFRQICQGVVEEQVCHLQRRRKRIKRR